MAAAAEVCLGTGVPVPGPVPAATVGRPVDGRSCGGRSVRQATARVQWLHARPARDDYVGAGPVQLRRVL